MESYKIKKLPIVNNRKKPAIALNYKGRFTPDDIERRVNNIVKTLRKKNVNALIKVNALFNTKDGKDSKWRSIGKVQKTSEEINIWENEDYFNKSTTLQMPKHFRKFQIIMWKPGNPIQKNNDTGDCLYECLQETIPNDLLKRHFPSPLHLKCFCGVKKSDGIPLDKIPMIEDKLGYRINVSGEYTYTSSKESKNEINLRLWNEHVTVCKNKLNKLKYIKNRENKVVMYKCPEFNKIECYDGKNFGVISFEKFTEKQKQYHLPFIYIKIKKEEDLKTSYDEFIKLADLLKEKTNGQHNLYKTGSIKNSALNRLFELNRTLSTEPLTSLEAEWISKSSNSGLMFHKKGTYKKLYGYDIVSEYPTIMSDFKFSFPIKQGKFKKLTQKEFNEMKYFDCGIYRAKIHIKDYLLMKENKDNYYTHITLSRAKELGYKIEIIDDNEANFLHYDKNTRIDSRTVFGKYINELIQLKKAGIKEVKLLLNIIWGALCEKDLHHQFVKKNEQVEIKEGYLVHDIVSKRNGKYKLTTLNYDQYYKTNFARLGPFLTARGRAMISRIMEPHIDYIVRCHTDGFLSTKPLEFKKKNTYSIDNVKIGTDIGDLKYEGYLEDVTIKDLNNIIIKETGKNKTKDDWKL